MYNLISEKLNWRIALYARLSREDEKIKAIGGTSESIENQIHFLLPWVKKWEGKLVGIYQDDGYTGTNFDRPGFQSMLQDIESGKINMVLTKDLSRLGRDYIEVGQYVERYFPEHQIRYIAINDQIDTFKQNHSNDMTPFKAVFNDMYAKDISYKVRCAIETKAKEGECIKAFTPYGLRKSPYNKNQMMLDDEVAPYVREIYQMYLDGFTQTQIARILTEKGVLTPLQYKQRNSHYFNPNGLVSSKWSRSTIHKILKDRIYIGDLVQLKFQKVNYKIKKMKQVPMEQQIIIPHACPAIIEKEIFEKVQEKLQQQSNQWNYTKGRNHLLSGLVYCQCGAKITYTKNHGKEFRCICSAYKKYGKSRCLNVHLSEKRLLEMVSYSLRENLRKQVSREKIESLKMPPIQSNKEKQKFMIKQKEHCQKAIYQLYEDRVNQMISEEIFTQVLSNYQNKLKKLERELLTEPMENQQEREENWQKRKNTILQFHQITEENRDMIAFLLERVIIQDRQVQIYYRFCDSPRETQGGHGKGGISNVGI